VALVLGISIPALAHGGVEDARVRIVHAVPGAPAVDVTIDGAPVLAEVAFRTVSEYYALEPGSHDIELREAGMATVLLAARIEVGEGKAYTVAATGTADAIKPTVFEDEPEPVAGSARLRFIHLSPNAPSVDIVVVSATDGGVAPATWVAGLAYPGTGPYDDFPEGTYEIRALAAGTPEVAGAADGVGLAAGSTYTAFAMGLTGDGVPPDQAFGIEVVTDESSGPETSTEPVAAVPAEDGTPILPLAGGVVAAVVALVVLRRRLVRSDR
jgi:hypothetical protein